jgi:hypothetical protein
VRPRGELCGEVGGARKMMLCRVALKARVTSFHKKPVK